MKNSIPKNWLYVIGAMEKMDRVKIGIASDVTSRINGLQCGSPLILHLWGSFQTHDKREHALKVEAAIHDHLSEFRMHGEWFKIHPKMALDVVERFSKLHPLNAAKVDKKHHDTAA